MHLSKILYSIIFFISFFAGLFSYAMEECTDEMYYALMSNGTPEKLKELFTRYPDLANGTFQKGCPVNSLYFCLNRCFDCRESEQSAYDAIQIAIDHGANVNAECHGSEDPKSSLPIIRWAGLLKYNIPILDLLIKNGSDINQSDCDGTVIQHLIYKVGKGASMDNYISAVTRALEHGADPLIKDKHNKTSFDTINLMKDTPSKVTNDHINKVEELLKNASMLRTNYLTKLNQRSLQKDLANLLEQPNNRADTAITLNSKTYSLHTSILSARCPALFALLN